MSEVRAHQVVARRARPPKELAVGQIFQAVRRRPYITLGVTVVSMTTALLLFQQPTFYRATAVLRLAGERRATAVGVELTNPVVDRTATPILSLVPRLRSRNVIGRVVDSLGLQLQPVAGSLLGDATGVPTPEALGLRDIRVPPSPSADTVYLDFTDPDRVLVWRGTRWEPVPYGRPIQAGDVRLTVPSRPKSDRAGLAVIPRDRAIDRVLSYLSVVPLTGTDVLEVNYTDIEPIRAQQVVNRVVQTFQETNIRSSQAEAGRRKEFLADQLKETDSLVALAQADLSAFRRRRQLANSSDMLGLQQEALVTLDSRRAELEADREIYQSLLTQLQSASDSARVEALRNLAYSPEIASDPVVGRLYQQLLVYRTRLDSLTSGPWRNSSTNPDVVQLTELLEASQEELVRAVRAHLGSLNQRARALAARRSASARSIEALPALQAEESRLVQQVEGLGGLADQLRIEYRKARMAEELAASDIELVDLATQPYKPVGVPWPVRLGVTLILGLLLAAAVATLLQLRDKSIHAPEELANVLPLPGLGVIPRAIEAASANSGLSKLRRRLNQGALDGLPEEIVADSQWPSVGAEAFRMLYSSLTFSWGEGNRTFLVTSVAPQEGKTFVAANLAATFAREGARVLLVDCDLRRPRLHHIFRVPREPGLMEMLWRHSRRMSVDHTPKDEADGLEDRGRALSVFSLFPGVERPGGSPESDSSPQATNGASANLNAGRSSSAPASHATPSFVFSGHVSKPASNVKRTAIRGLDLLPCGKQPSNPAEALQLGAVRSVLEEMAGNYDVIILDTPPVLVSADAAILAPAVNDVILVVRAGKTDREAAERAYQQLAAAGASLLGVVLNDPAGEVTRYRKLYYSYDSPPVAG
jgi:Mrp family chromosome partitioning ATPase/uncharacterized protein involved in exopolysaccharide biosynthesis